MLAYLFSSTVKAKLLGLLLGNPRSEFHVREAARRIHAHPIQVSKELRKAREAGVAKERKQGNLKLYSINRESPLYHELKKLFSRANVAETLKKALSSLKGVSYAMVFGSSAAGTESEKSDVDLFVLGSVKEDELLKKVVEAEKELGREIHYILWSEKDAEEKKKKESHLLADICKKPLVAIVGDENEFRKLAG